jgi:hypothetical protein
VRRRRTSLAASAVLALGLMTLPTACDSGPGSSRQDEVTPAAAHVPQLTGDLDGDGRDDTVALADDGTLAVRLAGPTQPEPVDVGAGARLLGLADVGGGGLAVVVRRGERHGPTQVVALREGQVVRLRTADRASLTASRFQAVWVDGSHRLLSGAVGSPGARRTAVYAQRWELDPARLAPSPAGEMCWDRDRDRGPQSCAQGEDYGPHVGSPQGLPALFPAAEGSVGLGSPVALPDGSTARLRGHPRPEQAPGDVRLVVDHGATHASGVVPAGWTPTLLTQPVAGADGDSGDGGDGLVVSQEGGDSDTWTVYVRRGGALEPATVASGVQLGGGFTADGMHARLSWLTPRGAMFTRVGLDRENHFRVYRWTLAGTVLRAHDLGEVCLDLMARPPDYGRC